MLLITGSLSHGGISQLSQDASTQTTEPKRLPLSHEATKLTKCADPFALLRVVVSIRMKFWLSVQQPTGKRLSARFSAHLLFRRRLLGLLRSGWLTPAGRRGARPSSDRR